MKLEMWLLFCLPLTSECPEQSLTRLAYIMWSINISGNNVKMKASKKNESSIHCFLVSVFWSPYAHLILGNQKIHFMFHFKDLHIITSVTVLRRQISADPQICNTKNNLWWVKTIKHCWKKLKKRDKQMKAHCMFTD